MDSGTPTLKKRVSFLNLDQTFVEIKVKKDTDNGQFASFTAHKELLCAHSEYFRRAFESGFKETQEKCIKLEDVKEFTFRIFLQWLYSQTAARSSGAVPSFDASDRIRAENWTEAKKQLWTKLCTTLLDLYVFGDKYDAPRLRHDVMTAQVELENLSGKIPDLCLIQSAYDWLPHSSTYIRYVVLMFAIAWRGGTKTNYSEAEEQRRLDQMPRQMLCDILIMNRRRSPEDTSRRWKTSLELMGDFRDCCNFHEHSTEEEREQCKVEQKTAPSLVEELLLACNE